MAIEFVSGQPSNGKSLRAMMIIEEELRLTRRSIVTNVAVKIPEFAEALNEKYGECFDLNMRLRILTPQETMCFWFFPAVGVDLDPKDKILWEGADGSKLVVPNLNRIQELGGTLWLIDEAHVFFSSRTWQSNKESKEGGFFFLSQHAKLKSDVILVTQHVERVDNQFRSIASAFVYMHNRSLRALPLMGGLVRQLPGFTQTKFGEPFRKGLHSEETIRYRSADKLWLAKCYETTAGVGITSRGDGRADKKPRGFPFYALGIPLVAVLVALYFFDDVLVGLLAGATRKVAKSGTTEAVAKSHPHPPAGAIPGQVNLPKTLANPEIPKYAKSHGANDLRVTGWAKHPVKGGGFAFTVFLSDGRELRRGFRFVSETEIEFEGQILSLAWRPNS